VKGYFTSEAQEMVEFKEQTKHQKANMEFQLSKNRKDG